MKDLPTGATTQEPDDMHGNMTKQTLELTPDAIRACFRLLDWRSLGRCSCVCRSWHLWASDPDIWHEQLRQHYYRPGLLQHLSLISHPAPQQHTQPHSGQPIVQPEIPAAVAETAKQLSSLGMDSTAVPNQYLQSTTAGQQELQVTLDPADLKQLFAESVAHPAANHQALLACFQSAMSKIQAWRLAISYQGTDLPQSGYVSDHSYGSSSSRQGYTGHPAPLTVDILQSAACWCIGCVQVQQQEQSCWLRFTLPAELHTDTALRHEAEQGHLTATVQALGPADVGWFDVASSSPFEIKTEDMQTLLESHKSGFYAWILEEDDLDLTEGLEPLPWEVTPVYSVAGKGSGAGASSHSIEQQVEQQVQQDEANSSSAAEVEVPQPRVRLVVYIHYEQLLQALPWQVPDPLPAVVLRQQPQQSLPLPELVARLKTEGLWLHFDVCKLRGGYKLGSGIAHLILTQVQEGLYMFQANQQSVLVAMYNPTSSSSLTQPVAAHTVHEQQSHSVNRRPLASHVCCSSSSGGQGSSAILDAEEGCTLIIAGKRVLQGGSVASSDGLLVTSAAEALQDLLATEEAMVDIALFDHGGKLLMGRAGVELWMAEQWWHNPYATTDSTVDQQPMMLTHGVYKLNFLIDGLDCSLWDNDIMISAAHAVESWSVPLVIMHLSAAALMTLLQGPGSAQLPTPRDAADASLRRLLNSMSQHTLRA